MASSSSLSAAAPQEVGAGGYRFVSGSAASVDPYDEDLEKPAAGHEMVGPDAGGLCDEQSLLNDPRFQQTVARIKSDPRYDPETIAQRASQSQPSAVPSTSSAAGVSSTAAAEEPIPDIIAYGYCKLLFDFLVAAQKRFPNRKMLKKTIDYYWDLVERSPVMPFLKFKDLIDRCETIKKNVFEKRTDENEAIVLRHLTTIPIFKMAKLHVIWCPRLDTDTKDKIWSYIQRLVQVNRLISNFDPDMRRMINTISLDSLHSIQKAGNKRSEVDVDALVEELQARIMDNDEFMEKIVLLAQKNM